MKTYVLVVTIYDKRKEYVLPQKRNADYAVPLQKKFFRALQQDIILKLEVLDGKWRLRKNEGHYLPEGNEYCQEMQDYEEKGFVALGERYSNGRKTLVLCPPEGKIIILEFKSYENLFRPYRKYRIKGQKEILIASDRQHADIYWNAWSEWKVKLSETDTGYAAVCGHSRGFFLNGAQISPENGAQELQFGDLLDLWGIHLIYLEDEIAVEEPLDSRYFEIREGKRLVPIGPSEPVREEDMPADTSRKQKYQRSVREKLGVSVQPEELEIAKPKERLKEEEKPLFMTLGPSLTMMVPMALGCFLMLSASGSSGQQTSMFRLVGLCTSVLSAAIGIMWTLLNLRYQKNKQKEEQMQWSRIHADYFKEQYDTLAGKYETTTRQLHDLYPKADACMDFKVQEDGQPGVLNTDYACHHLWERNKTHGDFLKHRIGLGSLPFQVRVHFQELENPDYDEGKHSPTYGDYKEAAERSKYQNLANVPVLLDLKKNPLIGIVGKDGAKSDAIRLAKALSAQIAAWNCYTEVKLAYIYDDATSDDSDAWEFARWLPHVWSKEKNCRYVASNKKEAKDVFYALSNIFRDRLENSTGDIQKEQLYLPHYVVMISDPSLLYGEIFAKYAFGKENNMGLTTVILTEEKNSLPNECTYIVELSREHGGECYDIADSEAAHQRFTPDGVTDRKLDAFARMLSQIQVAETEEGGELPDSLTFFDMLGVKSPQELKAEERWKKNKPYDHLEGMLGQTAGGAPCILDLHEKMHGPHGLVGGTTGSGKSETLQSYLLSLAVNYSPNDVAYFLIDYKGEGMAGLFERLPHKIGQMSNLSANQAERIMVSIRTENMRREQIFSENGVKNINEYRKLYEESEENQNSMPVLPHLFIVIDEFAQLKKDNPEFIDQLISVSQVGRSLGIHLILATQTPGGTVSGNIVSNSRFKICLRMQSKEDSQAMIGKKDAAYITRAGRGYLQVGMDELYEQFQSGYSGAAYFSGQKDTGSSKVLLIEEKPALVRTEGHVAKYRQKEQLFCAWIAELVSVIQKMAGELELQKVFREETVRERFFAGFYACLNAGDAAAGICLEDEEMPKPDYERTEYMDKRILHLLEDYLKLPPDVRARPVGQQVEALLLHSDRKYPEKKKETQFSATIRYLAQTVAADKAYQKPYRISKPLLKEQIYLDEAKFAVYTSRFYREGAGWQKVQGSEMREVVAGYMDDPANLQDGEKQKPFTVDFIRDGNTVIYGRGGAGKSTLMQALLYGLVMRYSPDQVRIYAADFDKNALAYFKDAPHMERVVSRDQMQQFWEMLGVINEEMESRRRKFAGYDYRKYLEVQKRAAQPEDGGHRASVFVFIDNFGEVAREMLQTNNQKNAGLLERIVKESAGMGIYFVISGIDNSIKEIPSNIAQCMPRVLCLELDDNTKYMQLLRVGRLGVRPEKDVKGRGLAVYGKNRVLEFQAVKAVRAKDGEREEGKIETVCRRMKQAWGEKELPVIGNRTKQMGLDEFLGNAQVQEKLCSPYDFPIGFDEQQEVHSIPLAETNCFGICRYGADGPGVELLEACVCVAMEKRARIVLIDDGMKWSSRFEGYEKAEIVSDEEGLWKLMQDDSSLWKAFVERNGKKTELFGKDPIQGTVLFDALKEEEPCFIFIKNMPWFILSILRPQQGTAAFSRWITLWEKGNQHHIYTFAEFVQDQNDANCLKFLPNTEQKYKKKLKSLDMPEDTPWPMQVFFGQNTGIHLGGNIARYAKSGFKYRFGELSETEKERPEKPEIGYFTDGAGGMLRIKAPCMQEGGNADGTYGCLCPGSRLPV